MSSYHTKEAFEIRMRERRDNPSPLKGPYVFWHIACVGDSWRAVVDEQLRVLQHSGLTKVTACVLGKPEDVLHCCLEAKRHGITLTVPFSRDELGLWEGPTLKQVWQFSLGNLDSAILYFHTKGVSQPTDRHKIAWRRIMQKEVIYEWKRNLEVIQVADMCGVSWQETRDFPHFCGNFYMARCDWIANLQDPAQYRFRHSARKLFAGQSWRDRMYVETWLGSEQWHHIESFCCRNGRLWWGPQVFSFNAKIPGFEY